MLKNRLRLSKLFMGSFILVMSLLLSQVQAKQAVTPSEPVVETPPPVETTSSNSDSEISNMETPPADDFESSPPDEDTDGSSYEEDLPE